MNELKQYLWSVECIADRGTMLECAAEYLAVYGREDIDTEENKKRYFDVYYHMLPPEKVLNDIRRSAKKDADLIKKLRVKVNHASGKEREQAQKELENAFASRTRSINEANRLERIIKKEEVADSLSEDWEALVNLKGLRSVRYDTDKCGREYPIFLFRVHYVYNEVIYDLGDIEVRFNPDLGSNDSTVAMRVRLAVHAGWEKYEPNYIYRDGSFCFGDRREEAYELRNKRRFIEALIFMDGCFHTINDNQLGDIPECFKELDANKEQIMALDDYLRKVGIIK